MLAYVFWHQPHPDTARTDYEAKLKAFHKALGQRAHAFRLSTAPWAPDGACYEDWYLIKNSAELDPLNDAAVSGMRRDPHNAVAAHTAWGAAGLYHLRLGVEKLKTARHAVWFAKPRDTSYDSLYDRLGPLCEITPAMLWQRFMVLGPTPEFCFLSSRKVDLMDIVEQPVYIDLDPIL
ncbi:MAG: hypothetical protein WD934_05250 [Gemmatimonadales bacterium]